jgi:N-acetylmuramoyl-L-alanine amidase
VIRGFFILQIHSETCILLLSKRRKYVTVTNMNYETLSDADLMALCIWREARGEGELGRRGVGHVIRNRAEQPCWWGNDVRSVILKKWQFSSFNENDPNSSLVPNPADRGWVAIQAIAKGILAGNDPDITEDATFYHDSSMGWPAAWGLESAYTLTLKVGRLIFYHKNEVAK